MKNPDHPEHLQPIIRDIMEKLGFPYEPKGNGQELDEKLTAAIYVIGQVMIRIGGIASLDSYIENHGPMTPEEIRKFAHQQMRAAAKIFPEYMEVFGKLMTWEPPKKGRKGKGE